MNYQRVFVALLVAPLATPFVFCAVWTAMGPRPVTTALMFTQLIFVAIYGLPVAYFAELSIGYITWKTFLAYGIRSPYAFVLAGAAIGAALILWFRESRNIPVFALSGAVSALLFRVIAFSGSNTAQKPATQI